MSGDSRVSRELLSAIVALSVVEVPKWADENGCIKRGASDIDFFEDVKEEMEHQLDNPSGSDGVIAKYVEEVMESALRQIASDAIVEIKESIKDELRMELFYEMEQFRKPEAVASAKVDDKFSKSTMTKFSARTSGDGLEKSTIRPPKGGLKSVMNGFESIKDTSTFNAKSDREIEEDLIASNPIFAKVMGSISRSKTGRSYTPDELNDARGDRSDQYHRDLIKSAGNKYQPHIEIPNEGDAMWDKLFAEKLPNY